MTSNFTIIYSPNSGGLTVGRMILNSCSKILKELKKGGRKKNQDERACAEFIQAIIELDKDFARCGKILQMKDNDFLKLSDYERQVAFTWKKVFLGHEFYFVPNETVDQMLPLIEEDWKTDFVSKMIA